MRAASEDRCVQATLYGTLFPRVQSTGDSGFSPRLPLPHIRSCLWPPTHTHTTVYLMLKVFSLTWLSLFSAAMDHFPCYQGVQMSSQCISERPWKPLHESTGVHLWFGNILDHLFGVKDPKPKPLMFYLGSCKGWLHFLHTFVLLGQVALAKHKETFIIIQNRSSFPNDMLFGGLTHSQHFFPLKKKSRSKYRALPSHDGRGSQVSALLCCPSCEPEP